MSKRSIKVAVRQRIAQVETQFQEETTIELKAIGKNSEKYLGNVTENWTHKVKFQSRVTIGKKYILLSVYARGENKQIFDWVDKGTKGPYIIQARKPGGYLSFRTGHQPKTLPVAKFNQGSGGYTGGYVKKKFVIHPGIIARNFTKEFIKVTLPAVRRAIENAFRRAARR